MSERSSRPARLAPAAVGELLGISVDEVMALVLENRLRAVRLGSPARWSIETASIDEYLDDQTEETRRMALWQQSNEASFPELWGSGRVRNPD
ncbi:DNA-binding protein [Microbacterium hominis]|uniref:DNA-binding protein n=1 Tax=Microbacterium hominis TaxID=162426 RepID=A0A7D4TGD1_9MICO|nr:DNA-binding protein [Microbacterium hominis]QKJ19980.1 DNA-binding protein [Microbacterium hominis]